MEKKKYWKSIQEGKHNVQKEGKNYHPEFGEWVENTIFKKQLSRRDFLKWTGLTTAATTLASCWEVPVRKAIPYFIQPEESIPGVAVHYATAYFDGEEFASLLVRTREGRPIKVEPHPKAPFNATSAKIQGSLFNLYDHRRLDSPLNKGEKVSWEKALKDTKVILDSVKENGKVRIVTPTIISPATKQLLSEFLSSFSDAKHIQYDVVSFSALLDAHEKAFGKRVIPDYRIDKAKVVLGVEADFLGGWLSAGEMARRYGAARRVTKQSPEMLLHLQAESRYSLTGSNADYRYKLQVGEHLPFIIGLYNEIAKKTDSGLPTVAVSLSEDLKKYVEEVSEKLLSAPGYALVLYGPNDLKGQMFAVAINYLLGAYDSGLADIEKPLYIRQGSDHEFFELVDEMNKGQVDVLILYDVNPAYDYAYPEVFAEALKKVKHVITLADKNHETGQLSEWVLPSSVPYESWRDYLPKEGVYFIAQPVFTGLYNAKQFEDILLAWLGQDQNFYTYLKNFWTNNIYPLYGEQKDPESLWQTTVHDGYFMLKRSATQGEQQDGTQEDSMQADWSQYVNEASSIESPELSSPAVYLYEPIIGTGRYSNNAWLQETPDPLTKVVWDNFVAVGPAFARENGYKTGDLVRVSLMKGSGTYTVELPIVVQPGIAKGVYAIAVGYGRTADGKVAQTGKNAFPFASLVKQGGKYYVLWITSGVKVEKTGQTYKIVSTQEHFNLEGRPIVRETTLEEWKENPWSGNEERADTEKIKKLRKTTFYPEREFVQHWDMVIDLSLCIGCGACVVACDNENNVPVVGKEEVSRVHEMHWMRIDLYYSGDPENPDAVYQPMLCQHCDHAPCENVCPVAATNSSVDGINQMAYNRCIGTRYCANNCPYKVRRFNWYDYTGADSFPLNEKIVEDGPFANDKNRLILNPDVVVRSRGVMEKCSFCIQRIQEAKLKAKAEGRKIRDGEIKTACQAACPTGAIQFGDGADKSTKVAQLIESDERIYYVLEELHTLPSVAYMTKIRNRSKQNA